jgi:hypothetical protein
MSLWPFPGDAPVTRARKVALAFREALNEVKPEKVEELDRQFQRWGELWTAPMMVTWGDDDWIPTIEAAKLIHINPGSLNQLRVRGRIKGRRRTDRASTTGMEYKVADVLKLSSTLRGRGWRTKAATDTVTDQGRTVSNDDAT